MKELEYNDTILYANLGSSPPVITYDNIRPLYEPPTTIPVESIKIPNILIKVIQKSYPEVDYVIPLDIVSEMRVSYPNHERCDIFLIHLKIVVNNDYPIRTYYEYETLFNRAFKAIHPEAPFVRFYVRDVAAPHQITNREKFINIFTK